MSHISKNNTYYKILIIVGILLTLLVCFLKCRKNEDNKAAIEAQAEFPDQEGWNSTVTSSVEGKVNAIINYGHMQRFKKRKVVEFDSGIEIDFYEKNGKHTTKLTSNKGKLNEATNNIEAFENVVVISDSNGVTLKTEQLWWDNSIEKVVSDKFVTITTVERDTFYGYGFESDQYLDNWIIKRFSGKAGRGFDLNVDLSGKDQKVDSITTDSTVTTKDSLSDTLSVNK